MPSYVRGSMTTERPSGVNAGTSLKPASSRAKQAMTMTFIGSSKMAKPGSEASHAMEVNWSRLGLKFCAGFLLGAHPRLLNRPISNVSAVELLFPQDFL